MTDDLKVCSCCKKPKFLTEFHKNINKPDGFANRCKKCSIESSRKSQLRTAKVKNESVGSPIYEIYVPEKAIYRNDGNKHILSRGVRC